MLPFSSIAAMLDAALKPLGGVRAVTDEHRANLLRLKETYPDLGPAIDAALAAFDAKLPILDAVPSAENIAQLPVILLAEFAKLRGEGLSPLWKPGSVTGG